uniref:Cystatin domain-containing protein n=1 Tax=Panagrellus redivivus TaxID=6233 RepID=A0A7E5A1H0_PANRE
MCGKCGNEVYSYDGLARKINTHYLKTKTFSKSALDNIMYSDTHKHKVATDLSFQKDQFQVVLMGYYQVYVYISKEHRNVEVVASSNELAEKPTPRSFKKVHVNSVIVLQHTK